jgi:RNA polymerase-binding transcription factor DksA
VADLVELAADTISLYERAAIAAVPKYAGESRMYCVSCEDEISEARRKAIPGVQLCIDCAREKDKDAKKNQLGW